MKLKYYTLLNTIVENGVESGWNWAHKHDDRPSSQAIKDAITDHIMTEFSEFFEFDESTL